MACFRPVLLCDAGPEHRQQLEALADQAGGLVGTGRHALALPYDHPLLFALPGRGATRTLWEALATVGGVDLSMARVIEPHLDAISILEEARRSGRTGSDTSLPDGSGQGGRKTWGVFAAERADTRLLAEGDLGRVVLSGRKPWCSLAGSLSHALVTAWVDESRRGLYAVALTADGVSVDDDGAWAARGLRDVPSGSVTFANVAATPIGEPEWYLQRPGFAWGGMGVAAVWFGATVAVARRVFEQAGQRRLDQIGQAHLGAIDAELTCARLALRECADLVDHGGADGVQGAVEALRCRQIVARAAETVLWRSDHALGPGPLALEPTHAARVADLHLYVRQEHAERDQAALGRALVTGPSATPPW